jgi:predicted phage-related endonuclease
MQLLVNIINKFKIMKSVKKRTLFEFLEQNKHLPEQGSIEWLKSRSETIGGSEISTILNINKYQSIKQLILQKTGLNIFKKAPPLWFGNIFEYILQQYVEKLYDTTIYETGSIPYKKSKLIKYSPDGLAVIKLNKLKKLFTEDDLNNKIFKS